MRVFLGILSLGLVALYLCAQTPVASSVDHSAPAQLVGGTINEPQGLPPRTSPSDYPVQAKLGAITLAAELAGHGIPAPDAPLYLW